MGKRGKGNVCGNREANVGNAKEKWEATRWKAADGGQKKGKVHMLARPDEKMEIDRRQRRANWRGARLKMGYRSIGNSQARSLCLTK